jgi:hypothetical protein
LTVALTDDGYLILAPRRVALYAAYLCEATDEVFPVVNSVNDAHDSKMDRWQISRRFDHIRQSIGGWAGVADELTRLLVCTESLKAFLARRSLVIHVRIYSDPKIR